MLSDIEVPHEERGILSPADREYLQHPEDYSRQAANEREQRIVERIRNALLDFRYLADPEFPDEYLEESFGDQEAHGRVEPISLPEGGLTLSDGYVEDSVVEAITLFHLIYPPAVFNDMIEEAVETAVSRYRPDIEVVDASYNPDIRDRGAVHQIAMGKLDEGDPLSAEETKLLLEYGEVDPDRVVEHVRGDGGEE